MAGRWREGVGGEGEMEGGSRGEGMGGREMKGVGGGREERERERERERAFQYPLIFAVSTQHLCLHGTH